MRITFIVPYSPFSGGVRVPLIYAREFRRMGHTVTVVTPPPHVPSIREKVQKLIRGEWLRYSSPVYQPFSFLGDDYVVADFRERCFVDHIPDADVIVATWWETAFAVQTLPPEKGRKIYFVQGHEVFEFLPSHISAGSYFLPMKKITVAGWLRDVLHTLYNDANVPIVHNSVDHEQFKAEPRARRPAPTIGFMYSHTPLKGANLAKAAISRARRQIPDLQVVAFGASAARAGQELPEGTRYFRHPPQDKLREIYAMCDGWLMPSHSEGFALPILEAMACRTPVISTRTGVGPDIIEDGRNGYLVDPGDATGMAEQIIKLLSQGQAAWSTMSEAAYAVARRRTWEDAAREFEAILATEVQTQPNV